MKETEGKLKVKKSSLKEVKHERETYPYLRKLHEKVGFQFQRFEGSPTVPDIWVGKGREYFWIEVKVYKGAKALEDITIEDLTFEPGQRAFRYRSQKLCFPSAHRVFVFNKKGHYVVM